MHLSTRPAPTRKEASPAAVTRALPTNPCTALLHTAAFRNCRERGTGVAGSRPPSFLHPPVKARTIARGRFPLRGQAIPTTSNQGTKVEIRFKVDGFIMHMFQSVCVCLGPLPLKGIKSLLWWINLGHTELQLPHPHLAPTSCQAPPPNHLLKASRVHGNRRTAVPHLAPLTPAGKCHTWMTS